MWYLLPSFLMTCVDRDWIVWGSYRQKICSCPLTLWLLPIPFRGTVGQRFSAGFLSIRVNHRSTRVYFFLYCIHPRWMIMMGMLTPRKGRLWSAPLITEVLEVGVESKGSDYVFPSSMLKDRSETYLMSVLNSEDCLCPNCSFKEILQGLSWALAFV